MFSFVRSLSVLRLRPPIASRPAAAAAAPLGLISVSGCRRGVLDEVRGSSRRRVASPLSVVGASPYKYGPVACAVALPFPSSFLRFHALPHRNRVARPRSLSFVRSHGVLCGCVVRLQRSRPRRPPRLFVIGPESWAAGVGEARPNIIPPDVESMPAYTHRQPRSRSPRRCSSSRA